MNIRRRLCDRLTYNISKRRMDITFTCLIEDGGEKDEYCITFIFKKQLSYISSDKNDTPSMYVRDCKFLVELFQKFEKIVKDDKEKVKNLLFNNDLKTKNIFPDIETDLHIEIDEDVARGILHGYYCLKHNNAMYLLTK